MVHFPTQDIFPEFPEEVTSKESQKAAGKEVATTPAEVPKGKLSISQTQKVSVKDLTKTTQQQQSDVIKVGLEPSKLVFHGPSESGKQLDLTAKIIEDLTHEQPPLPDFPLPEGPTEHAAESPDFFLPQEKETPPEPTVSKPKIEDKTAAKPEEKSAAQAQQEAMIEQKQEPAHTKMPKMLKNVSNAFRKSMHSMTKLFTNHKIQKPLDDAEKNIAQLETQIKKGTNFGPNELEMRRKASQFLNSAKIENRELHTLWELNERLSKIDATIIQKFKQERIGSLFLSPEEYNVGSKNDNFYQGQAQKIANYCEYLAFLSTQSQDPKIQGEAFACAMMYQPQIKSSKASGLHAVASKAGLAPPQQLASMKVLENAKIQLVSSKDWQEFLKLADAYSKYEKDLADAYSKYEDAKAQYDASTDAEKKLLPQPARSIKKPVCPLTDQALQASRQQQYEIVKGFCQKFGSVVLHQNAKKNESISAIYQIEPTIGAVSPLPGQWAKLQKSEEKSKKAGVSKEKLLVDALCKFYGKPQLEIIEFLKQVNSVITSFKISQDLINDDEKSPLKEKRLEANVKRLEANVKELEAQTNRLKVNEVVQKSWDSIAKGLKMETCTDDIKRIVENTFWRSSLNQGEPLLPSDEFVQFTKETDKLKGAPLAAKRAAFCNAQAERLAEVLEHAADVAMNSPDPEEKGKALSLLEPYLPLVTQKIDARWQNQIVELKNSEDSQLKNVGKKREFASEIREKLQKTLLEKTVDGKIKYSSWDTFRAKKEKEEADKILLGDDMNIKEATSLLDKDGVYKPRDADAMAKWQADFHDINDSCKNLENLTRNEVKKDLDTYCKILNCLKRLTVFTSVLISLRVDFLSHGKDVDKNGVEFMVNQYAVNKKDMGTKLESFQNTLSAAYMKMDEIESKSKAKIPETILDDKKNLRGALNMLFGKGRDDSAEIQAK